MANAAHQPLSACRSLHLTAIEVNQSTLECHCWPPGEWHGQRRGADWCCRAGLGLLCSHCSENFDNIRDSYLTCRCRPPAAVASASGRTAAAAQPRQRLAQWWGASIGSSSSASSPAQSSTFGLRSQVQQHSATYLLSPVQAAADGSGAERGPAGDAADELPLWRLLRQQAFSADSLSRLQAAVSSGKASSIKTGERVTEQKLQRDVAPNIVALRAEGLDTASIERLFEQYPPLLTATQTTLSSSLAALRQLAALVPNDPRAVQAPPGATPLGVAVWLYPAAAAYLLTRTNLGSLIDSNLQLRRQLGISGAKTAKALLKKSSALVSNFERAEAMVAHLQRLQASGALSAEQGEQTDGLRIAMRELLWFAGHCLAFTPCAPADLNCSGRPSAVSSAQPDPCQV